MTGSTFHLVARAYYDAADPSAPYLPEAFAADGFIHCTDGADELIAVANRYYRDDPREYIALVIDTSRVTAEVRYDDAARLYPHIYGALNRDAITGTRSIVRGAGGEFLALA